MPVALDLVEDILRLKKEKNAVILAHNYQVGPIQDIADYVGDSLGLAYQARETDADVIAFCGVHFMAETAKILNPEKTVVLPDKDAGCSLEQACPADQLAAFLKENAEKNYYVIAYINCSAGVKALCDVICTSGNAPLIVEKAPLDRPILFVPDANLGQWVMEQTGRKMDLWQGSCYVHVEFTRDSIHQIKDEYPDALVVAHPECTQAVRLLADEVCSTEKMIHFCKTAPSKNIVVVTESGMLHRLRKECPDKNLIAGPTDHCACADCRYMKMNTLEKLHACLDNLEPRVEIPEKVRVEAEKSLVRMLEQSR
ncbi:quinolinate synthase NadA [Roseibacillus ishigakijimensis]|uniref:Quinolinate synthase n=1 Tax=Roseibacillus ishigakijimensis TaxID=454146 RepID=A0A934RNY4_9BACT|nr:quinolinate synthase NadA [Roseibacillus ishigakijimensis]MBK1834295.1 quinolinate synthase NadA [Roseibacillus ishigakijimensis]